MKNSPFTELHPDDILLFQEIAGVVHRVAAHYRLPLKVVEPYPMPSVSMADRLGDCAYDGTIRLVMRATVDGKFCEASRTPEDIWRTAAHELAHLRHMNHGAGFLEFELEMRQAVANMRVDHRQKVIDRLVKMQASRDGEAKLGNSDAAEAFAAAINRMLIEHELSPSDLDYARTADSDPVIELTTDLTKYRIKAKRSRIAWQENLARVVANAHLCKFLVSTGSNRITFVGTKSHATVAEYSYGTLVRAATDLSVKAYRDYCVECGRREGKRWLAAAPGFAESWLSAFIERIAERMRAARAAAVQEVAPDVPGGVSSALMRLDGALVKAQSYIDNRFKSKRYATALQQVGGYHSEGRRRGREAADRMAIGQRALTGQAVRGYLS